VTSSDCPNWITTCSGGYCRLNLCDNYSLPCDAGGSNDGVCAPYVQDGGWVAGYCMQGGTSFSDCVAQQRCDPSQACVPGSLCTDDPQFGYSCTQLCDPDSGLGCPGGTCEGSDTVPGLGTCF
jgi:hypothetical protein